MMTQRSKEQGNCNQAELETDIESAYTSVESFSLSEGSSENSEEEADRKYHRALLQAAFRGDWVSTTRLFEQHDALKTAKITSRLETLLHIAALSAHDQFLENLVELLSPNPEVLAMVDCDGRTALHNAVLCGRIRMVKALVRRNHMLTQLANKERRIPLAISALEASMHKEIAWFLAEHTTDDGSLTIETILDLTSSGHYDITLYLVGRYPRFLTMTSRVYKGRSILWELAMMESHFPSGTRFNVVEELIYKCIPVNLSYKPTNKNLDLVPIIKRIREVKLRHMMAIELAKKACVALSQRKATKIIKFFQKKNSLNEATIRGITEIVKLCIQIFPEFIWIRLDRNRLETEAVKYRQERTLGLFLTASSTNKLSLVLGSTEEESKEMMSAAAAYAETEYHTNFNAVTTVAGAAFQMQRELQWYKAVESWVLPTVASNYYDGKTYWNIFVEEHKQLIEKGEKWVKDTANSCMLVSTLIATILFTAAFTVPGGNDDKTGVPLFLGHDSFLIFAISDALGLFSSVTTILLFLAILTSRYEAQDFLYSLPTKIIIGLSLLFLSLAFMLVAFATTLALVLDTRLEWALIPVTLLACVPVALFAVLQLPLLFQMAKSTYGPSIFRSGGIWDGVGYTNHDQETNLI